MACPGQTQFPPGGLLYLCTNPRKAQLGPEMDNCNTGFSITYREIPARLPEGPGTCPSFPRTFRPSLGFLTNLSPGKVKGCVFRSHPPADHRPFPFLVPNSSVHITGKTKWKFGFWQTGHKPRQDVECGPARPLPFQRESNGLFNFDGISTQSLFARRPQATARTESARTNQSCGITGWPVPTDQCQTNEMLTVYYVCWPVICPF